MTAASDVSSIGVGVHDGVGAERILHIPTLPVGCKAIVEVPVHGLAQALRPVSALLPSQGCQLLIANEVPMRAHSCRQSDGASRSLAPACCRCRACTTSRAGHARLPDHIWLQLKIARHRQQAGQCRVHHLHASIIICSMLPMHAKLQADSASLLRAAG